MITGKERRDGIHAHRQVWRKGGRVYGEGHLTGIQAHAVCVAWREEASVSCSLSCPNPNPCTVHHTQTPKKIQVPAGVPTMFLSEWQASVVKVPTWEAAG